MDENINQPTVNLAEEKPKKALPKRLIILGILVLVVGATILYSVSQKIRPKTPAIPPEPERITRELIVPLVSQGNSGVSGRANIFIKDNKTMQVLVQLDPFSTKNPQAITATIFPAQIRNGACPTPGEVKFPLTNIASTSSNTTFPVDPNQLQQIGPLSIAVQKSATEAGTFIACGNLQ